MRVLPGLVVASFASVVVVFSLAPRTIVAQSPASGGYQAYENGAFGLTGGQTARVHVLNRAMPSGMSFEWRFVDEEGRVVARSASEQNVEQGRTHSFDLNGDALRRDGGRSEVHVLLNVRGRSITEYRPGFTATVEVVDDTTGRSSFMDSGFEVSP